MGYSPSYSEDKLRDTTLQAIYFDRPESCELVAKIIGKYLDRTIKTKTNKAIPKAEKKIKIKEIIEE